MLADAVAKKMAVVLDTSMLVAGVAYLGVRARLAARGKRAAPRPPAEERLGAT